MTPTPSLPSPHIARPHLVERICQRPVTLITAPAGFGKSALLVELLAAAEGRPSTAAGDRLSKATDSSPAAPRAIAFCRLTPADQSAPRLLARLTTALGAPPDTQATLVGHAKAAGLAGLAIDGLELLPPAGEAAALLDSLLAGLPAGFRLLLAGRSLPSLPALTDRRLRGEVLQLGPDDLRFTPAESQAFLSRAGGDPRTDADAAGWPAALGLLGRSPAPDWRALNDYLQRAVIDHLDPDSRRLLTDLAVLSRWSAAACGHLLDRKDGAQLLQHWERSLPTDRTGQVHPLLRRWLTDQLGANPDRARALHRRAALWHVEQGEPQAGLQHALAAGDLGLAIPLLRQTGRQLLASAGALPLDSLLEQVPDPVLEAVPELLLPLGEALRRAGSPRRAARWLRAAALGFTAAGETGGLYRAFCRLALAHADLGEWSEMQAALHQIETELADARGRDRAEALRALALGQLHQNQAEAAAVRLQESAALFLAQGDQEGAGLALTDLGAGALVALQRWDEARATLWKAQSLLEGASACDALLTEVLILLWLERYDEADGALQSATPSGPQQLALLHWLAALPALHRGETAEALRLTEQGHRQAEGLERRPGLQGPALLADGWTTLAGGNPRAAVACARQLQQLAAGGFPLLALLGGRLEEAAARLAHRRAAPAPAHRPAAGLRIEVLGDFRLLYQDQEVPLSHWGRAQVRAVFQCLLLQPGFAAHRELLLETFWPGEPPPQARARLRVVLNRLRQALQPLGCHLEHGTHLIRLPQPAIAALDLLTFREHLAAARRLHRSEPAAALEPCRAALALYRGPLLPDAFWPGAEEYRQRAHLELIELLRTWQGAALQAGLPGEAITALSELVRLEPGDEEAARSLMELLHRNGRRSEAIRLYHELARWLKEELGIDPAPETQHLLRQLLT